MQATSIEILGPPGAAKQIMLVARLDEGLNWAVFKALLKIIFPPSALTVWAVISVEFKVTAGDGGVIKINLAVAKPVLRI